MPLWRPFTRARGAESASAPAPPPDYDPSWYRSSFDADYERIYRYTDDTAAREVSGILKFLGLGAKPAQSDKSFLDVGCGWGRHAVRLARRGYRVTGVDLSEVMLRKALTVADDFGLKARYRDVYAPSPPSNNGVDPDGSDARLQFVRCDMRALEYHREYDFAINIFTSFGYFPDEADNHRVLAGIYEALRPGGRLLIDVDNPLQYLKRRVGMTYVTVIGDDEEGHEIAKEEDFDDGRARRVVRYRFDGDERPPIYLECALYDRDALSTALTEAGFKVGDRVWGDFDGMRYSANSPRLIMVGTRR